MKTSGWNVKSKCDGYVMWGLVEPKSEHVDFSSVLKAFLEVSREG